MRENVRQPLPVPPHFNPANAAVWSYEPDVAGLAVAAEAWRREQAIAPAADDQIKVHLLLIDVQKDFCFPEGTLYVGGRSGRGAIDDNVRLVQLIYRELPRITTITATLDSHLPFQIFFPWFFVDREGRTPPPHTLVTSNQVRRGDLRPNPALVPFLPVPDYEALLQQTIYYCEELERAGKYTLYLWPPHCLLGSAGHALVGVIQEARLFHAFTRLTQPVVVVKGDHPLTEHYSALRPEVLRWYDGKPLAEQNDALIRTLLSADEVVVAGQAASHCVRSTVLDLIEAIESTQPELARKVTVLRDCMSAVAVPDGKGGFVADFTPEAEAALRRFEAAGMRVVSSGQWAVGSGQ